MEPSCFVWNVDPILFSLGPLTIRWYGLMFSMVFLFGYYMLAWQFRRAPQPDYYLMKIVIYLFLGVLLGSYFGHRIFYETHRFFTDPLSTMSFKRGISGLSSHGATLGIIISILLFHRRSRIRILELMDRFTFSAAGGATLVRIGNLMNSEIVGRKTDSALAVCFPRFDHGQMIPRYPSQVFEIAIGITVLIILLIVDRAAGREKRPLGLLAGTFLSSYFFMRFFVEFFKEYQTLPTSIPLTMGQFLSIPFFLVGVTMIVVSLKKRLPAAVPVPDPEAKPEPTPAPKAKKQGKKKPGKKKK